MQPVTTGDQLVEAIHRAAPGSLIRLEPGMFQLPGLAIDRPIRFVGLDPDKPTTLEFAGPLRIEAEPVEFKHVSVLDVRSQGGEPAPANCAVHIQDCSPRFHQCAFRSVHGSAIGISGPGARPLFSKCLVHDCGDSGFLIADQATPTLEECTITGQRRIGIVVEHADVRLLDSVVSHGLGNALVVRRLGECTAERCRFEGNDLAQIVGQEAGMIDLTDCQIRDGRQGGVFLLNRTPATIDCCTISANAGPGIEAGADSTLTLRDCTVGNGLAHGVLIVGGALAVIVRTVIQENRNVGLGVLRGARATVTDCVIREGQSNGLTILDDAEADVIETEIYGNAQAQIGMDRGGRAILLRCRIHSGTGTRLRGQASARLKECDLHSHSSPAIDAAGEVRVHAERCELHSNRGPGILAGRHAHVELAGCSLRDSPPTLCVDGGVIILHPNA